MPYVYIIAFCVIWVQNRPKIKLLNRKPFNCELCMAFWTTFVYQYVNVKPLAFAFVIALITPIVYNLYNKTLRWGLK